MLSKAAKYKLWFSRLSKFKSMMESFFAVNIKWGGGCVLTFEGAYFRGDVYFRGDLCFCDSWYPASVGIGAYF